jgi:uncharacterized damage-inducible protein DinB
MRLRGARDPFGCRAMIVSHSLSVFAERIYTVGRPMTINDLERLYDYGYWANGKVFSAITQLKPELFVQPVAGSYGSVRNTLVHAMSAEWVWLERCGGKARGAKLNPEDYPTSQSVIDAWTRVEQYVREFLSTLTDQDLTRIVDCSFRGGPPRSLPLGALMQHGALHAIHHRGQVALLLRELGVVPGNFDLLFYDFENRSAAV